MHAVAGLRVGIRDVLRSKALVDRRPRRAAIVAPERASRGDRDVEPLMIRRVDEDRVEAEPARARLPVWSRLVVAQPWQFLPVLAGVNGAEERGVLHAGIDCIGIAQRRLDVPDALELPRMRRAVVPLV